MSRDWTPDELAAVSKAMKTAEHMSYEEFCAKLKNVPSEAFEKPPTSGHMATFTFKEPMERVVVDPTAGTAQIIVPPPHK